MLDSGMRRNGVEVCACDKKHSMVFSCCGRPTMQKRYPAVCATLASTVFGKTDWGLHADRSCGECGESEDHRDGERGENEEEDPMSILMDVSEPAWETPKKKA